MLKIQMFFKISSHVINTTSFLLFRRKNAVKYLGKLQVQVMKLLYYKSIFFLTGHVTRQGKNKQFLTARKKSRHHIFHDGCLL
jgi:hypothetical protein